MPDKNRSKRKYIIIGLITAVILAAGAFWYFGRNGNNANQTTGPDSGETSEIDFDPPTEEEKKEASDRKDEILNEQNQTPPPGAEKRVANPVIVDAGQYGDIVEVRAFAPGTVDSDGKCTFTFTLGTNTVTKQSAASPDASSTRCANLQVPRSEFTAAGTWQLNVTYDSSKAHGSSSGNVEVK
jgi:hypothetical protein